MPACTEEHLFYFRMINPHSRDKQWPEMHRSVRQPSSPSSRFGFSAVRPCCACVHVSAHALPRCMVPWAHDDIWMRFPPRQYPTWAHGRLALSCPLSQAPSCYLPSQPTNTTSLKKQRTLRSEQHEELCFLCKILSFDTGPFSARGKLVGRSPRWKLSDLPRHTTADNSRGPMKRQCCSEVCQAPCYNPRTQTRKAGSGTHQGRNQEPGLLLHPPRARQSLQQSLTASAFPWPRPQRRGETTTQRLLAS